MVEVGQIVTAKSQSGETVRGIVVEVVPEAGAFWVELDDGRRLRFAIIKEVESE